MFRAVTGLSFLKRHHQSSFRLTSNEIEVPTTNVKDLKGSNEDMKELVVKDKFVVVHWNGLRFPGLVLSVAEEEATVECMAPTKEIFEVAPRKGYVILQMGKKVTHVLSQKERNYNTLQRHVANYFSHKLFRFGRQPFVVIFKFNTKE
ncbi:hypothetical protein J6590_081268 [Homalodisca vitripennis]|nr:hypothetical protein J6590_081268 [Homalodisca vitripennis]